MNVNFIPEQIFCSDWGVYKDLYGIWLADYGLLLLYENNSKEWKAYFLVFKGYFIHLQEMNSSKTKRKEG